MLLSDISISQIKDMIEPFEPTLVKNGNISYGLSSYGYDARLAPEFDECLMNHSQIIDPKNLDSSIFTRHNADYHIIPPHGFVLCRTLEYFKIPEDILVICLGKSTYARCGLLVNVTPLEPGWEGHVTLELSNTTPLPVKVYANEGICQFLFFRGDQKCAISYASRKGKYMGQRGITHAKM